VTQCDLGNLLWISPSNPMVSTRDDDDDGVMNVVVDDDEVLLRR
jgi:hypothetical protein